MNKNRGFRTYCFFFGNKKIVKRQIFSAWNFLETPTQVYRGASILYFNSPFFCFPLFFEDITNLKSGLKKMVNKRFDYHLVFLG